MSWWIICAALLCGLGAATITARIVKQPGYRRTGEHDKPRPRTGWLYLATPLGWACVAALTPHHLPVALIAAPLLIVGPYLAYADLDVRRLPDRVLLPATAATLLIAAIADALTSQTGHGGIALADAAGVTILLWVIHRLSRGQLGFGDVKLVFPLAFTLAHLNWTAPLLAVLLANITAVAVMIGTRQRHLALGPWLLAASATLTLLGLR